MFAGLGILLMVAGAVLVWAVEKSVDGLDLQAIGWIMIGGGALALLVAAIRGAGWMSLNKTAVRTERHVSGDGDHLVEETRTI